MTAAIVFSWAELRGPTKADMVRRMRGERRDVMTGQANDSNDSNDSNDTRS
jgi:hypothetical protein